MTLTIVKNNSAESDLYSSLIESLFQNSDINIVKTNLFDSFTNKSDIIICLLQSTSDLKILSTSNKKRWSYIIPLYNFDYSGYEKYLRNFKSILKFDYLSLVPFFEDSSLIGKILNVPDIINLMEISDFPKINLKKNVVLIDEISKEICDDIINQIKDLELNSYEFYADTLSQAQILKAYIDSNFKELPVNCFKFEYNKYNLERIINSSDKFITNNSFYRKLAKLYKSDSKIIPTREFYTKYIKEEIQSYNLEEK